MFTILVVEDDGELRKMFCSALRDHGYRAIPAADGAEALNVMERAFVDLIICDVMMPNMDGFELTRALREAAYDLPILMITVKDSMEDKQTGFYAGIDDYMVKPVNINEMMLRITALLRRARINSERRLVMGDALFDCDTLTVTCRGETVELPQKEFFLLYKLVSFPNRIFTRRQLMDEIWGIDSDTDPHTLDVHISRLRHKFKNNGSFEIMTVRGLGYKAVRADG